MNKVETIIKLHDLKQKIHKNTLISNCKEIEETLAESIKIIEGTLDTGEGLELPRKVEERLDYHSGSFHCPNCKHKIGDFYHVNTKEVTRCLKCNQRLLW